MGLLKRLVLISSLWAAGCSFKPKLASGAFACGPMSACPSGQHCGSDNRCYGVGEGPTASVDMAGGDGGDAGVCVPKSCADQHYDCGPADDGCGNMRSCGQCDAPNSCGGGGTPNRCGCEQGTCATLGFNCGEAVDGCGTPIECGACSSDGGEMTCGGGGHDNVCGSGVCVPKTCNGRCGKIPDGCGKTLDCGGCSGTGQSCGGGGTANMCGCTPLKCSDVSSRACGTISDGCGAQITCPACPAPQTCANDNQCLCTPATACPSGANCGTAPDGCGGTVQCASGGSTSCGLVILGGNCGGGGPNTCGGGSCSAKKCVPNVDCGVISDGCTNVLNCGSCPAGKVCGGGGTAGQCG